MSKQKDIIVNNLIRHIQTIQLERKTGLLTVRRGKGTTLEEGTIAFVNGHVTEAKVSRRVGTEAFNGICTWESCAASFISTDVQDNPSPPIHLPGKQPRIPGKDTTPIPAFSPLRKRDTTPIPTFSPLKRQETMPIPAISPLRKQETMPLPAISPLRKQETMPLPAISPLRKQDTCLSQLSLLCENRIPASPAFLLCESRIPASPAFLLCETGYSASPGYFSFAKQDTCLSRLFLLCKNRIPASPGYFSFAKANWLI